MSEEIKEILDFLKDEEEYYDGKEKVVLSSDEKVIERDDINQLLDYITNLQQKVKQLENIRKEAIEYVLKNKLYKFKYDDEELFEITTDKKAKDDLLNILNKGGNNVKD